MPCEGRGRGGNWTSHLPLMVECDRDTEEQIEFRTKIAQAPRVGTSEKYRELYQARRFNVAFFIQAPRRDPIDRLTEVLA